MNSTPLPRPPTRHLGWVFTDTWTLVIREMRHLSRRPDLAAFGITMGLFFLLLFNYVFGGAIGAGTGVDYPQFLVPGILVITTIVGAGQSGVGLAEDLGRGVVVRFRSLPMYSGALLAARPIGDVLRNIPALALLIPFAYLVGFRFASLPGAAGAVLLSLALGFAFSWINAAIATVLSSPEAVNNASMFWLFPLMFASSLFTPAGPMPAWLSAFADNQPLSVTADAVRALSVGEPAGTLVLKALLWDLGLVAIFAPLSAWLYRRRVR
jgi:ABC-2 type transport system permease protein